MPLSITGIVVKATKSSRKKYSQILSTKLSVSDLDFGYLPANHQ